MFKETIWHPPIPHPYLSSMCIRHTYNTYLCTYKHTNSWKVKRGLTAINNLIRGRVIFLMLLTNTVDSCYMNVVLHYSKTHQQIINQACDKNMNAVIALTIQKYRRLHSKVHGNFQHTNNCNVEPKNHLKDNCTQRMVDWLFHTRILH